MWKSITGRITLIAVLTAASIIILVPSLTDRVPAGWKDRVPKINLGLDLQGGVTVLLEAIPNKGEPLTPEQVDGVVSVMRNRIDPKGVKLSWDF